MTASDPVSSRRALATRLSHEMLQAEREGFGTSTAWLTREETDLICAALEAVSGDDVARLDFLDRCRAAMTARDGSNRGWRMSIDPNSLMLGTSSEAHSLPSCREAIDGRMAELQKAQAAATREKHRHEPFPARPDGPHDVPPRPYARDRQA